MRDVIFSWESFFKVIKYTCMSIYVCLLVILFTFDSKKKVVAMYGNKYLWRFVWLECLRVLSCSLLFLSIVTFTKDEKKVTHSFHILPHDYLINLHLLASMMTTNIHQILNYHPSNIKLQSRKRVHAVSMVTSCHFSLLFDLTTDDISFNRQITSL